MAANLRALTPSSYFARLGACTLLLAAVVLISPGFGTTRLGLIEAWRSLWAPGAERAYAIAFQIRMPQTLLALTAGMTLSLCGAVFQTLFRNPLATPYTLGIASGGSLGALLALKLGLVFTVLGVPALALFAFAGACGVVAVVMLMARGSRKLSTHELLLAGVTLGLFCSAMMMVVIYFANPRETFEITRWMMGSLEQFGHASLAGILPLLIPSWIVLMFQARALNQYALGDELAASRGVSLARLQGVCVIFSSLATAAVVSICGPIGFVGLVVPHMVAPLVGRDCRVLLPASAIVGGAFLIVCHWISQVALRWGSALVGRHLEGVTLPIGVVTAVIGVPIFLVLLRRQRG